MSIEHLLGKIHNVDCIEFMKQLPDKCVDLILCDLPYGTTACAWDTIIPFVPLWEQYNRIIKNNRAVVLSCAQPFTSALVMSNIKEYKHHWVWLKEKGTGFQVAKYRPMMAPEDLITFCKGSLSVYNPQMLERTKAIKYRYPIKKSKSNPLANYNAKVVESTVKFPENVICINTETGEHPTQKPVALFEYMINTYSNNGEIVFDNCMGSGTTAVACERLGRRWFGCELEPKYCEIANKRIEAEKNQLKLF